MSSEGSSFWRADGSTLVSIYDQLCILELLGRESFGSWTYPWWDDTWAWKSGASKAPHLSKKRTADILFVEIPLLANSFWKHLISSPVPRILLDVSCTMYVFIKVVTDNLWSSLVDSESNKYQEQKDIHVVAQSKPWCWPYVFERS